MQVFAVLVARNDDEPRYILSVYGHRKYAEAASARYMEENAYGWAEVQSFYVV